MSILHEPLQKTEEKEIFPCSFYEATIILITKLKQYKERKLYSLPNINTDANILKILADRIQQNIKSIIGPGQVGSTSVIQS